MADARLIADAVDDYGKALVREVLADLRAKVEALAETRDLDPWDWNEVVEVVLALIEEAEK